MMKFRLIGLAALSLMLAAPAMAMQHGYHHHYSHVSHRVSRAYAFDRGYDFAPGNVYSDFDRRNTFN
jgi:hypothetical protein